MKTRNQEWAVKVFPLVEAASKNEETYQAKYRSMCHKMPVLIRTAGLAQALAFVQARGEDPHKQLLADLSQTVIQGGNTDALVKQSREAGLDAYMHLTREVLGALLWFQRNAQTMLKEDGSGDAQQAPAGEDEDAGTT